MMKATWQIYVSVLVALALLLLVTLLYVFRLPLSLGPLLLLISVCPCVSASSAQSACDACVFKALTVALAVVTGVPLLFYVLVCRGRRRQKA